MNILKLITIDVIVIVLGIKCDNITLDQTHPIDKTKAIFNNADYVVFNSEVNVAENHHALGTISFEIKSTTGSKFQSICDINVEICETQEEENCACTYKGADKYFIVVNITANVKFSAGTVRGVLIFMDYRIYSNTISLPLIFDTPSDVCLFVDAQKITDLNHCNATTSKDQAVLFYFCASASSYKLEIVDDYQNYSNGFNIVVHTLNTTSQRSVTFYQKDIVSNLVLRTFQCTVHSESVLESCPHQEENSIVVYIVFPIGICILIAFFVIVICYKNRKYRKKLRRKTNEYAIPLR